MSRFVVIDSRVFKTEERNHWVVIDLEHTGEIVAAYKSLRLAYKRAEKENASCQKKES